MAYRVHGTSKSDIADMLPRIHTKNCIRPIKISEPFFAICLPR